MAHHVYTTQGVVLTVRGVKEADAVVVVLTRDLGLVLASARGVRKRGSKLSGILLELALVKVSLVRGRQTWRITTATLLRNCAAELRNRKEALGALARVTSLIRKLIRGEDKHTELFNQFETALRTLLDKADTNASDWEIQTVARILLSLGYLRESDLNLNKREIVKAINTGLQESGLA